MTPQWKDEPDVPGLWYCRNYGVYEFDAESINQGHYGGRCYGPIPPDPEFTGGES